MKGAGSGRRPIGGTVDATRLATAFSALLHVQQYIGKAEAAEILQRFGSKGFQHVIPEHYERLEFECRKAVEQCNLNQIPNTERR